VNPYNNVCTEVSEAGELTITIDLKNVTPQASKSGKSLVYATTGGAARIQVGDNEFLQLNLTLYKVRA